MDWSGWATFGLVATAVLTVIMSAAQVTGLSRMDIPLMLGTMFVDDLDRARVVGSVVHLVNGQMFALVYASAFSLLGEATWLLGGVFGAVHGLAALTVVVPLLPGVHPRMASDRSGPSLAPMLEPPGFLGLNYGTETPVTTLAAHVVYGMLLGGLLTPT